MVSARSAAVLWFTGLSGAGKSTIAGAVADELSRRGVPLEYLDGDAVRLLAPAGFSRAERDAHVKRVGFMASRLEHHGITVICALISPYREARAWVRDRCARFIEIHVATPLGECERRDVKGLYARARRGEITSFTGIDDPYEPPDSPELTIDTSVVPLHEAVASVIEAWEAAAMGEARAAVVEGS
jgi:adenylylsulfate kinase